ncbi:flavin oxidoreductase [Pseudooceanicola lipolyticus]|uniref:Flavin oxidoreductase n=1 Tax=Pseudooceanicola lipolyticus TaxID=2029104 RepID=A0A2M8IXU0_9RHOB|nr:flavin reductase family protein [Pseudooceanicola lipolyticus]PJE35363.1 flavin oxidoreductase [Pseudooceanicola lipolyticus]
MPETTFTPGPETQAAYREALGSFGTGVTVVTTMTPDGPTAMTANSFASVSLDPPLVLWCPARASRRHDLFTGAEQFIIHVMAQDQEPIAAHFASRGSDFSTIAWHPAQGQPRLDLCLTAFLCRRSAVHPGGDHSIVVGEVQQVWHRDGLGLIFKRGRYGDFTGRG